MVGRAVPRSDVRPEAASPYAGRPTEAPAYSRPAYSRPAYSRPSYSRPSSVPPSYARPDEVRPGYVRPDPYYSRPYYTDPYYARPYFVEPYYYARPYYVGPYFFRPRFSLGFGLFVGYPVPYPYAYPYPVSVYGYAAPSTPVFVGPGSSLYGGVSLEITPGDAGVYVDGGYAGVVRDFDGTERTLTLTSGRHRIEVSAPGYEPMTMDVDTIPGQIVPYRGDLQPLQ